MGKVLYLECESGISGDMTVAALLDAGADEEVLNQVLSSVPVQGFKIKVSRVKKSGVDACDFDVLLDEQFENHDHDMEYLYGHDHEHEHHHDHVHDHEYHDHDHAHHHDHDHEHDHDHHHDHHHIHRGLKDVQSIILQTKMTAGAKKIALEVFTILAASEAKAHGTTIENVHFHEVGAVDSIVDVISAAVCLDNLGVDQVIVPKVCEGRGTVRCQHGILPIPVPAVANVMEAYNLPVEFVNVKGELVTPTGAAFLAAVTTSESLPKQFRILKIGIGAGKREYERPGILRAMIIEEKTENEDQICKLESNIDDCTGENLGYVMEKLFAAGARDVHYMPVVMKKSRPGWQLNVICTMEDAAKMESIIFRETTTIGIRRLTMERSVLSRTMKTVQTPLGEAMVKVVLVDGKERYYPEYNSVVTLCEEHHLSYMDVYQIVRQSCE